MRRAIQFGAGNIGRGFIGGLLSKSGYHVVFADVNMEVLDAINNDGKYSILVKDVECFEEVITNISGVSSTSEDIIVEIAKSQIITTAVGPLVLPRIAPTLAKGIQNRKQNNIEEKLNIIACENAVCASDLLKEEILKYLNNDEKEYLNTYVGFPNSSVDRIVPPGKNENPLDVTVEHFYEWNVEKEGFKGEIPSIAGMNLVGDLMAYVERKLFTLNTGHAITAYLGHLNGYKTVDESIKDEKIFNIVRKAMRESGEGLAKKHNLDIVAHYKYIDKILNRFKNPYLNDDVIRVGREPLRKLSIKDRLINPLLTAKSYDLPVDNLIIGISAALHYYNEEDAQSVELQNYIKELDIKDVMMKVSNIEDKEILSKIETAYNEFLTLKRN
jgi:mannitol-1-phosphate 5-dehydrogenase